MRKNERTLLIVRSSVICGVTCKVSNFDGFLNISQSKLRKKFLNLVKRKRQKKKTRLRRIENLKSMRKTYSFVCKNRAGPSAIGRQSESK